ncbi:MAG TPA: hypothetical protein VFT90_04715 [Chryseosolibacter sp.]|nr:hypothetical protein [Chryseosolibacter sp.]
MEIEDLKDIWKKQSAGFKPKDERELADMLKGRSTSIVTRLKRNVWFELIFTCLGGLALLIYALTSLTGSLKWTSISIIVLFAMYSLYYIKKLRLLNAFETGNDDLKSNLKRLIENLRGYLKFYKRSYSVLYPAYFVLGLSFTAIEHGASGFLQRMAQPEILITLLLGAILFFIFSTWLTTWYLNKLYGNHLKKLESLLEELQQ